MHLDIVNVKVISSYDYMLLNFNPLDCLTTITLIIWLKEQ